MSTARLIRWSGPIAILGGVLFPVAAIIHPASEDIAAVMLPSWVPAHLLGWVSVMLIHFGLIGLYARQAEKAGWLGLVGFVLAFVGGAFATQLWYEAFKDLPLIAARAPAAFDQAMMPPSLAPILLILLVLGFILGHILFGLATMRAGVLPRWSGLLVATGMAIFFFATVVLFLLGGPLPPVVGHSIEIVGDAAFGLGVAWMGYALWSAKGVAATQVSPAS